MGELKVVIEDGTLATPMEFRTSHYLGRQTDGRESQRKISQWSSKQSPGNTSNPLGPMKGDAYLKLVWSRKFH